jgi:hypothetical protein
MRQHVSIRASGIVDISRISRERTRACNDGKREPVSSHSELQATVTWNA